MQKIAIIIPCYNEEKRLKESSLLELIQNTSATIFLANDGSKDQTLALIEKFASQHSQRVCVINYSENQGKANTIYKSVNHILGKKEFNFIGYFDADFSTPSSEVIRMIKELDNNEASFIFGSRVLLLNSQIERKRYRHIIGRIIVTIINTRFGLGVYDTQCGAKIFSTETASIAFSSSFFTSWLFDVEVFIRLRKKGLLNFGKEFPLKQWKDIEGSKLSWKTGFKILRELNLLMRKY